MAELSAAKPYEKVGDHYLVNCGKTLTDDGGGDQVVERNANGYIYVKNGEPYTLAVLVGGETLVMAEGVGDAKPGNLSALWIRARHLRNVPVPVDPGGP